MVVISGRKRVLEKLPHLFYLHFFIFKFNLYFSHIVSLHILHKYEVIQVCCFKKSDNPITANEMVPITSLTSTIIRRQRIKTV